METVERTIPQRIVALETEIKIALNRGDLVFARTLQEQLRWLEFEATRETVDDR